MFFSFIDIDELYIIVEAFISQLSICKKYFTNKMIIFDRLQKFMQFVLAVFRQFQ